MLLGNVLKHHCKGLLVLKKHTTMNNFLSRRDVQNIHTLLADAKAIKQNPFGESTLGKHKTLVLLFFNNSLRTRLSTQKAAANLGMNIMTMNVAQGWGIEFEDGTVMNLDKAEHVKEAAAVISQYADIIGIRTFAGLTNEEQDYKELVLRQFVKYTTVPILNLESATVHPLQSFTDLFTIESHKKKQRPKVVLTWAPHPKALPQAVANSFVEWIKKTDYELVITHPEGYDLSSTFTKGCTIEYDQNKAFENADFVYAKNWSSHSAYGKILSQNKDWMITQDKMALTNNAHFMHCLPVRRNVVVEDAVLDSPQSLVIQQAANRAVAAQTVLSHLLKNLNQ